MKTYQDLEKEANRTWDEIYKEYMQSNTPNKHHPHKTLDGVFEFMKKNYNVPERK